MKINECPLCGACDIRAFKELDHRKLGQCHVCTHMFAYEYDETELDRLYWANYYSSAEDPRIKDWISQNMNTWEAIFRELASCFGTTIRDLLDIGAGSGGFLSAVHRLSPNTSLFAVESSENACDSLRNRMPEVTFLASRAEFLRETDRRFDCITILQCLEHVSEPMELLRNAFRCLRDDGLIMVTVPNRHSYQVLLRGVEETLCYSNQTHLHFFSRRTICHSLSQAGFSNVRRLARYGRGEYVGLKAIAQYLLRKIGLSTELRYIARKNDRASI